MQLCVYSWFFLSIAFLLGANITIFHAKHTRTYILSHSTVKTKLTFDGSKQQPSLSSLSQPQILKMNFYSWNYLCFCSICIDARNSTFKIQRNSLILIDWDWSCYIRSDLPLFNYSRIRIEGGRLGNPNRQQLVVVKNGRHKLMMKYDFSPANSLVALLNWTVSLLLTDRLSTRPQPSQSYFFPSWNSGISVQLESSQYSFVPHT